MKFLLGLFHYRLFSKLHMIAAHRENIPEKIMNDAISTIVWNNWFIYNLCCPSRLIGIAVRGLLIRIEASLHSAIVLGGGEGVRGGGGKKIFCSV